MVFNFSQPIVFLILLILFIWLVAISFILSRAVKHYNHLTDGISKKTLNEALEKILKDLKLSDEQINNLNKTTERLEKDGLNHMQKIGLLRFNPFEEVGGDQSFVLALLNGENDGVVLTSLTSRTGTRWYGKTIKNGEGVEHELSKEEKDVIKIANN